MNTKLSVLRILVSLYEYFTKLTEEMKKEKKERIFEIIFKSDTPGGKLFDVVLLVVICVSIMAVILESVDRVNLKWNTFFRILEWIITGIFTIEYAIRIWVARRSWRYILSFYGLVDLLAIVPTFLGLFIAGTQGLMVIRAIRLLRIFRILKLSRYTRAANTITEALRSSIIKISVFLFAVLTLVIIIGTAMYLIEGKQNDFENIPTSIYWAIVTLTTVGYGDIVPITVLGKIMASLVMIMGYGIIAVPTGIVTAQVITAQRKKEMLKCNNCGSSGHESEAKFCKNCGHELGDEWEGNEPESPLK